jgi:hypothetical protein
MNDPRDTDELVDLFAQANPNNVDPAGVLTVGEYTDEDTLLQAIRDYGQTVGYTGLTGKKPLKASLVRIRAQLAQQGQQAPAPPAQPARQTLREFSQGRDITSGPAIAALMNPAVDPNSRIAEPLDSIVSRIKGEEDRNGRVFNANNAGDVDYVMQGLMPSRQQIFEQEIPDEADRRDFVRRAIRAMRDLRIRYANQEAQDNGRADWAVTPQQQTQQTLYGMGRKSNAKAFLRGCGVPNDVIGTSMMRHGLNDASTVDDLVGSGIMDTLKDFAGSVADSASGWFDTIKANMPTMSDVRRAVGKIVPDSMSDYVPSGLQRTFGDKAKDFFGFGMAGGEFHGDPRPQHARHREPFENVFDDKGYRQGAVHRMTSMFVPDWEVSSGIHNLKGGDQLYDHDPEVLRRQDHHDVSLYRPAVIQQPIHGYGHDGDEDEVGEGGLHQRLRKPLPFDTVGRPYGKAPMFVHRVEDHDMFAPADNIGEELGHYMELEKPADMDEDPNPFRVRTENHKVNTGKMKKVTYHTA